VFADFEGTTWGTGWTATGDFTTAGPVAGAIGDQQPVSGYLGQKLVNTFLNHDLSMGTIDSPTFTISSDYIDFLIGGGNHPTANPWPDPSRLPSTCSLAKCSHGDRKNETLNCDLEHRQLAGQQAQSDHDGQHLAVSYIIVTLASSLPEAAIVDRNRRQPPGQRQCVDHHRTNSEQLDWAVDVRDLAADGHHPNRRRPNTGGQPRIPLTSSPLPTPALSATERAHWPDGRDFRRRHVQQCAERQADRDRLMNNWQYGGSIPR
jgi:levanase